jgi:hypothetical protein
MSLVVSGEVFGAVPVVIMRGDHHGQRPLVTFRHRLRAAAIRSRFASRPAGVTRQQREHSGAVRRDRTRRPQDGHGWSASGSGSPARRARYRRVRAALVVIGLSW